MIKPLEIRYIKKTNTVALSFEDGISADLTTEYLRCFSPSAEVKGHGPGQEVLQVGKEDVNISAIDPVGNYAVRLVFDDNHDSGFYTFEYLYQLGAERDRRWQDYLDRLAAAGHTHSTH